MTRPNIIYLHSHDTGRQIQPFGAAVRSPNLQRLAEQGVSFRRAFSAAPTCSPSRASLLTGQWPHQTGMLGLAHRGFALTHPDRHLATTLRDAGYDTVLAGVQHVTQGDPRELGYTTVHPRTDERTAATVAAAIETIRHAAAHPDQPFFLDAGFFETHRPFPAAPADAGRWLAPPPALPDTESVRHDMADFQASLTILDDAYGAILDALDAAGLADNTLVVATTDHGIAFPWAKCNLTDAGTGVLLILRGPGIAGGRVLDALVSQVDLYPTMCEIAGIDAPGWLTGQSLLPLLRGEVDAVRDELFAEVTYHAAYEPQRLVRTDRWALIRRFGDRRKPVLPNLDDSPSREVVLAAGYADVDLPELALYDTVLDPQQRLNLVDSRSHRDVRDLLVARLARWMEETDDPLRHGEVPIPPGGRVNAPDSRTFSEALLETGTDGTIRRIPNPGTIR